MRIKNSIILISKWWQVVINFFGIHYNNINHEKKTLNVKVSGVWSSVGIQW